MPVAKKYEMLGDRDATKLKLELEGGSNEKRENPKKVTSTSETTAVATVTTDNKEQEGAEVIVKKEEEMDTSDVAATVDESVTEDAAADQSMKEESAANADLTKDNVTAYDPNVAIGIENRLYCALIENVLLFVLVCEYKIINNSYHSQIKKYQLIFSYLTLIFFLLNISSKFITDLLYLKRVNCSIFRSG